MGRSPLPKSGNSRPENLRPHTLATIGNLCFIVAFAVFIFTIIAVAYELDGNKITMFLKSASNFTLDSDKDFRAVSQTAFNTFINLTEFGDSIETDSGTGSECEDEIGKPIDCRDPEVFHTMIRAAIDKFYDIHFYRFGKPVRGSDDTTCDMAWRFKPKEGNVDSLNKDYRRFKILRSSNCLLSVVSIGDYHSGLNARKPKKKPRFFKKDFQNEDNVYGHAVGDLVNDTLPVIESEKAFKNHKYLIYVGRGDRCKSMNHYLWSFSCALGEARYLNRTLVLDLSICLSSLYTQSGVDEEGKDFRSYFDFQHLKDVASVIDQAQFWTNWNSLQGKDDSPLHLIEDSRVTPMKLKPVKDTLIMRKFGTVEPDNYWYQVCEGDIKSVIQRPWHMIQKSRRLMAIVSAITTRLNRDYDSIHVVNFDLDTSPDSLLSTLQKKINVGRKVYVATDEPNAPFFDQLKGKYSTHFLDEYKDLWAENTEWYSDMVKLNNGAPVEFDGYMRILVDSEVFLRGKKRVEMFKNVTRECKDGVNACDALSR